MPSPEEPQLFDLPLDPEPQRGRRRDPRKTRADSEVEQAELPFFAEEEPEEEVSDGQLEPPPGLGVERCLAALADIAVHLALLIVTVAGIGFAGILPGWEHAPALALFVVPFSFVYSVVPLAFWGQTPGMAWRELRSRSPGGESLTVGQSVLRWLGGMFTLLFAGLPLLLLLTGRSLPDRLSGSETDFVDIVATQG